MASASLLDLPILLTPEEVAARLRVTTGTLAVWRCTKRYRLQYVRVGRAIRYRLEDVEEFLRQGAVPR
jgi:excisionase family DNA binding protein